jgi:predicted nucleic acid-binding protein
MPRETFTDADKESAYFDTSVLTRAYCNEPGAPKALAALQKFSPVISPLVQLEFSSAVAKKFRLKLLSKPKAATLVATFHDHIRQGIFEQTPLMDRHYAQANEWIDLLATSVRALDSLHLAVAHSRQLTLVTADDLLAKAARTLGIGVLKLP